MAFITIIMTGRFDLGKVLTTSARDYCGSRDMGLQHYEMRGVHGNDIGEFLEDVPKKAEVVVDFRAVVSITQGHVLHESYDGLH